MKAFAALLVQLEQTTQLDEKTRALKNYFTTAAEADKIWALALLTHYRPPRQISTAQLQQWVLELTQIPLWLFEECYAITTDRVEALTLILPSPTAAQAITLSDALTWLLLPASLPDEEKAAQVRLMWDRLQPAERLLFNKLLTGTFRLTLPQSLLADALAAASQTDVAFVSHQLAGTWQPHTTTFGELFHKSAASPDSFEPYPFAPIKPIAEPLDNLDFHHYLVEWHRHGTRVQVIKRQGQLYLWSVEKLLLNEKLPELMDLQTLLPNGTAIEGLLLPFKDGKMLSPALLQTRLAKKKVSKKDCTETPVLFDAYDLLEWQGKDMRSQPLTQRRATLVLFVQTLQTPLITIAETLPALEIENLLAEARQHHAQGLLLKSLDALYPTANWLSLKAPSLRAQAVLLYARKHTETGRFTDFTLGVWDGEQLVPIAQACADLPAADMAELDAFIKQNILERFGPVRTVEPHYVFEIMFDDVQESRRHKAGLTLLNPRITQLLRAVPVQEATQLHTLRKLLVP